MKQREIKDTIARVLGIETLNAIQGAVAASDARRMVVLSPTGSGKTLAFTIAILQRIDPKQVTPPRPL